MKKKSVFSVVLFLIGLRIMLYPFLARTLFDLNVRNEADQITEAFANDEISNELYNQQIAYNQSTSLEPEEIGVAEVSVVNESEQSNPQINQGKEQTNAYLNNENVLGILSIPRINLVYPIYDGATYENLLNGVARIEGTSYPVGGINTNSVISGHKGFAGQIFFSKIDRLVADDLVYIQNRKETLVYEVYDTAKVEADDVAALAVIPGQDTVTLLTCVMPRPFIYRYLVYAKRVGNEAENELDEEEESEETIDEVETY